MSRRRRPWSPLLRLVLLPGLGLVGLTACTSGSEAASTTTTTSPPTTTTPTTTTTLPEPTVVPPAMYTPSGAVVPVLGGEEGAWLVATPCAQEAVIATGEPIWSADVVIDPGHGGREEPGAVGPMGLEEADLNMDVAERLVRYLDTEGVSSVMVRTGDYFMRIPERAAVVHALEPQIFVSLHHNGGPAPVIDEPGVQTFHQFEVPGSERLAGLIEEELLTAFSGYDDVDWVGVFPGGQYLLNVEGTDYYGVLRRTPDTVSVLVEALWLSNGPEEELLWRRDVRQAEAEAIGRAIVRYLRTDEEGGTLIGGNVYSGSVGNESTAPCIDPDLEAVPAFSRLEYYPE